MVYVIIRQNRYFFQPNDLIKLDNIVYAVRGTHNKGSRVILKETGKSIKVDLLTPHKFMSGLVTV